MTRSGAISEYQSQLIDSVKEDIRLLQDKFKLSYQQSESYRMSQIRDHPPVAGAIVWAKQIERQLSTYMHRVEDVLGDGWQNYADGEKLNMEHERFKAKLDTKPIFDAWLADILRKKIEIVGPIFQILKTRGTLSLAVNFDSQIIMLFKEVRNLLWLGFGVPHGVGNVAKDAKRVYPLAVSLMETVRTYEQTVRKVEENPGIVALVSEFRGKAQLEISRCRSLRLPCWSELMENRYGSPLGALYQFVRHAGERTRFDWRREARWACDGARSHGVHLPRSNGQSCGHVRGDHAHH